MQSEVRSTISYSRPLANRSLTGTAAVYPEGPALFMIHRRAKLDSAPRISTRAPRGRKPSCHSSTMRARLAACEHKKLAAVDDFCRAVRSAAHIGRRRP